MIEIDRSFVLGGLITWVNYIVAKSGVSRTVIRVENIDSRFDRKHVFFVTFFDKAAISLSKNANKGDSIRIEGCLNNNIFINKDGYFINETQLIGNYYDLFKNTDNSDERTEEVNRQYDY